MAKDNTWVFVIVGIVVLIAGAIYFKNTSVQPQTASISATYYDSNKNQIDFKPYNYDEAMKSIPNNFVSQPTSNNFIDNLIKSIGRFGMFGILNPNPSTCINCINESEIPLPVSPISSNSGGGT